MTQLLDQLLVLMATVPAIALYGLVATWVGVESSGIGVPVEPMMLFAGSLAARGAANLALAIASAVLGCLLFATIAYLIGRRIGTKSLAHVGRFVGLNQRRADQVEVWLRHRGMLGVVIARVTPIVRTYGSYIMGAADITPPKFLLGTLLGSTLYTGAWTVAGNLLGENYRAPLEYLDRIGPMGVLLAVSAIVMVLIIHHLWGRLTLRQIAMHFRTYAEEIASELAHIRER